MLARTTKRYQTLRIALWVFDIFTLHDQNILYLLDVPFEQAVLIKFDGLFVVELRFWALYYFDILCKAQLSQNWRFLGLHRSVQIWEELRYLHPPGVYFLRMVCAMRTVHAYREFVFPFHCFFSFWRKGLLKIWVYSG